MTSFGAICLIASVMLSILRVQVDAFRVGGAQGFGRSSSGMSSSRGCSGLTRNTNSRFSPISRWGARRGDSHYGFARGCTMIVDYKETPIELGGIEISAPMGVGAWAWGDKAYWGYDPSQEADAKLAFSKSMDNGINLFDTAEVYGIGTAWGHSEVLCGRFARDYARAAADASKEVIVATKFAAIPPRTSRSSVLKALRESLERLGADRCDLYQLHWPSFFFDAEYWDGLADAYDAGLIRAVGVSNYSAKRVAAVHRALAARGVPLASNQVQYSLAHRTPERNGVRQVCEDLGVRILAYSPLAQGLLTGAYSESKLPTGPRGMIFKERFTVAALDAASDKIPSSPGMPLADW